MKSIEINIKEALRFVNADKVSLNAGGTGITSAAMQNNAKSDDAYYTLSGIKINKPGKGLFIHNGKKIVR